MAINEKASQDATSKAPVLVYSVNQDGWPASSPVAPPPPPRLTAAALMPQPPPPPRLAAAALMRIKRMRSVSLTLSPHPTPHWGGLDLNSSRLDWTTQAIGQ